MADSTQAPAPITKACDGCGRRVPIKERRMDTGLCQSCQATAVVTFDIEPEQAGVAVLAKKKEHHYTTGAEDWKTMGLRARVRRLLLANTGNIRNPTEAETNDAKTLRAKYPISLRPTTNHP
jgi:hypothetical protein